MSTSVNPALHTKVSWRVWYRHPEKLWVRGLLLHIHLWVGMLTGLYVLVMSLSGSIIVFRNQLERVGPVRSVEWFVDLHENLLLGMTGRAANGIGAMFVTLSCLTGAIIWWPGIVHWRRSLTVIGDQASRGSIGIFITRSDSGAFCLSSYGESRESILPFRNRSTVLWTSFKPLARRANFNLATWPCFGCPICTSAGSTRLPRPSGRS
jgi:hypothetical protein